MVLVSDGRRRVIEILAASIQRYPKIQLSPASCLMYGKDRLSAHQYADDTQL